MSRGDLFIVGGNEDKTGAMPVLAKFVEISRARPGPIGILTTATNYPEETGEEYSRVFEDIGAPGTVCFHIGTREEAEEDRLEEQLEQLASLYITGGDQVRLTSILGGTAFYSALQKVWRKGLVIGGTSAGAAVMSRQMIMSSSVPGGGGQLIVEMGAGFGFLEDVIIDQHFSQRARFTRLMNAIAHNPQIIGVGVDENTAIWVQEEGSFFEVLGEHTVTIFDGKKLTYVDVAIPHENKDITISGVRLHSLAGGYRFDLQKRELMTTQGREQG